MPFGEPGAISESAAGGGQDLCRQGALCAPGPRPLPTRVYGGGMTQPPDLAAMSGLTRVRAKR